MSNIKKADSIFCKRDKNIMKKRVYIIIVLAVTMQFNSLFLQKSVAFNSYSNHKETEVLISYNHIVKFVDPAIEKAVRELICRPHGYITRGEVSVISEIAIENEQIRKLDDLKLFTNLKGLYINSCELSDISAISGLIDLTSLGLKKNRISDISPISSLTNLKYLNLENNQIKDISTLSSLTNLETIFLAGNQISDISPVSGLANLKLLDLDGNRISDISVLSRFVGLKLEHLGLGGNQVCDISVVSGLRSLTSLCLTQNRINNIDAISGLTDLRFLDLALNQISDISAVSGLTNLLTLDLVFNNISDISALSSLKNLDTLWLSDNKIKNIDAVSNLTSLKQLSLDNNEISDIGALSGLKNLHTLTLTGNPITDYSPTFHLPNLVRPEYNIHLQLYNSQAFVNGMAVRLAQHPVLQNNRIIVPFRFLGESLGAEVFWEESTRTVKYKKAHVEIQLQIDNDTALVNGTAFKLDAAPQIINNVTMVPLRFIGEALALEVIWVKEEKSIIIK